MNNIEKITKLENEFKAAMDLSQSIIDTIREPLLVLGGDLKVMSASRSFYDVFKVKKEQTIGEYIYDLGNKQWDIPKLRQLLEDILAKKASFDNFEVDHEFPEIGRRIMLLNARRIPPPPDHPKRILLAIEDITEKEKEQEREVQEEVAKEKTKGLEKSEAQMKKSLNTTERMNKLMVGRELEMARLKKEIQELKDKLKS